MLKFPKKQIYKDQANFIAYGRKHIYCERCGALGEETHHIVFKGMAGANRDDRDSNLLRVCRPCHQYFHGVNSREAREEAFRIKEGK